MINDMKVKSQKSEVKRGFTLIETLIAVLLLATAITGPLTIASKGLTATLVAKDQFTAFYLAQDAIEYVRYVRDSSCLAAGGGPEGCPLGSWMPLLANCGSANGCYFDSLSDDITPPTACGGTCPAMKYDSALKKFSYTSGTPTPQRFVRTVSVESSPSGNQDEVIVTVTLAWSDVAGVVHAPVIVRENLFRWQ